MDAAPTSAPDADALADAEGPPPTPPLGLAVGALVLLFLGFLVLGFSSQVAHLAFGLWFTQLFVFLALAAILVRRSGRSPVRFPGLLWIGARPVAMGFVLGVANFLAVIAPVQYLTYLVVPGAMDSSTDALLFEQQTPVQLALVVGAVSLAAPFCEEYFFRGVVQPGFRRAGLGSVGAVGLTAALFSLFHLQPVKLVPLLELGLLFGLLRLRTRSLWPAIAAHSGNNSVTALLFLTSGAEASDAAASGLPEPTAVAAVAGLGGLLLLGLLLWVRSSPRVMPPHEPFEEPPALPHLPAARLYGPWVAGMAAAVALLFAVDGREVRLNVHDFTHPLPGLPKGAPPVEGQLREGLRALRARAERGEAPLEEYYEARRRLRGGPQSPGAPPPAGGTPVELPPGAGEG
jgi:membrane protease YdiL (CAAX protease family)